VRWPRSGRLAQLSKSGGRRVTHTAREKEGGGGLGNGRVRNCEAVVVLCLLCWLYGLPQFANSPPLPSGLVLLRLFWIPPLYSFGVLPKLLT
jgi:hypothetical protein